MTCVEKNQVFSNYEDVYSNISLKILYILLKMNPNIVSKFMFSEKSATLTPAELKLKSINNFNI